MKILDCSLRDGGYYTNWDFDRNLVNTYIKACNDLPVDYLEVGYRSIPLQGYYGEYFYLPIYVMQRLKAQTTKKLVIILNEKDIRLEHVQELLSPCLGLIDMVRLAIDPQQFGRALTLAEAVKKMGFEVGFNVMYMSKWKGQKDFLELLPKVKGIADYFYMVDSYGGVYPQDVKETIQLVRSYIPDVPLGFHGHNNMELALINTLTAIEEGCAMVDATVTGMGRGAGNVKTELLLTALNAQGKLEVDFNPLSKVVDAFSALQKTYEWGTNLPYMVSGAHSLPQKDVMDWVGKRYYSFNSIIRALQNQAKGVSDNISVKNWENKHSSESVLIVGGGPSVQAHKEAIIQFLNLNKNVTVVHASSKNALTFEGIENQQIFCLVGNEGHRMEEVFKGDLPLDNLCVLPPSPRKMGTYIPSTLIDKGVELNQDTFSKKYIDSHCFIALQVAKNLNAQNVYLIGFDGYAKAMMDEKAQELFAENTYLFNKFQEASGIQPVSLVNTSYPVPSLSIFSLL
ncbi:aldolase catalytic domain-containing protein [Mongoliitalea daihaiensis]|uniref:aldolase catalytic domain-containing protein n=1 Tax=Mongoliitalea daihaiensis TaxID=2782006 RepID=UPI001F2B6F05|nr:aldolase catalytic domain-containing protein [Mongoliitalea daihaiensis]UJP64471.1 aldolase catalytic domain-containing protein [Mongoliitalea daihaiensis]